MEDSHRNINSHTEWSNATDAACAHKEEDRDTSDPEPLALLGDVWEVYIMWMDDSTESVIFRIVGDEYSGKLSQFEDQLEQEFMKNQIEPITTGMLCIAYFEGRFSRVKVVSIEDGKVNCFFPDYGGPATLNKEHIKRLDPEVNRRLPYQAIQVSLHGLQDIANTTIAVDTFCDLTREKTCIAVPANWDENAFLLSVVLFDITGDNIININEEIRRRFNSVQSRYTFSARGL
ncbi:hypothetical protein CHS0354_017260 [Potamilus streckersoni]|uniref:Tudor domain-containing protein n=1 Tax=Potamilus streckersoni TaxID=2493646 RepID=A0AAE0VKZ5_9BIVA|nr:hypothetical protein CHS0354_017260 [Potamilus streckersoni]